MIKPICECGMRMRRIYSRRGAQGKKHYPEGWLCNECGVIQLES